MKNSKKYIIKIPKKIQLIYCSKKKIVTFFEQTIKKSSKIELKLLINKKKRLLEVTNIPFVNLSKNKLKKIKSLQGTTFMKLKQLIIETSTIFYKKLQFVGVGYKVIPLEEFQNKIIRLKLGFSHLIYIKFSSNINFFCKKKLTQLFIFGNSYTQITHIASLIRSFKKPEPYKGKGILYKDEKILLKEGKKI